MARTAYRRKAKLYDAKSKLSADAELKRLRAKIRKAQHAYHNSDKPIMSDTEYDRLEGKLRKLNPKDPLLQRVGATPKDRKVTLPYPMPSLDKLTKSEQVTRWLAENAGPYVVSDKLDGVSAMHVFDDDEHLYTRGNGLTGSDISHMLDLVSGIGNMPRNIEAIRGELVVSRSAFAKKYSNDFSNARNMASGLVNATKSKHDGVKDLTFFVHSVVQPETSLDKIAARLRNGGYNIVPYVTKRELDEVFLLEYLGKRRKAAKADIDGLVVTARSGNAVAFKAGYESAIGIVDRVEWKASAHGYLKPVVHLKKAVRLAGANIKKATGHNARFVLENRIGPGAHIELVRSGDVIPKITGVPKQARKADMPDDDFVWVASGADIVLRDASNVDEVIVRRLVEFLIRIGVDRVKEASMEKIVDAGIDTIPALVRSTADDFEDAGVGRAIAQHLATKIRLRLKKATLSELMAGSGLFGRGFGVRRAEQILNAVPFKSQLATYKSGKARLRNRISEIPGIGLNIAQDYVDGLSKFVTMIRRIKWRPPVMAKRNVRRSGLGVSPIVVFTGFRDASMQDTVRQVGGQVGASITKATTHVVAMNTRGSSGKLAKARNLGIPILSIADFRRMTKT